MQTHRPGADRGATGIFAHVLALAAASALVIASAGFGGYFAWSINRHHAPTLAALAVLMALGLELAKPLAVSALFAAVRSWRLGQALGLFALAAVAIVYSLTAELQLMALSRADAVAGREHDAGKASAARETRDALRAELARTPAARSPAELEPLIAAKVAATKGADCTLWVESTRQRAVCVDVAQLRAEAARGERRDELAGRLAAAERALADAGPQRVADPSAVALATYLGAFGLQIEPRRLGDWLVLVAVFALEIGSMFAAALVTATRPNTTRDTATRVSEPLTPAPLRDTGRNAETPALPAPERPAEHAGEMLALSVPPAADRLEVAEHPAERVLALLRDKGGEVFGSQRTLALAVGVSPARLNRVLHELAGSGRVNLCAGKAGTRVQIAH